MNLNQSDSQIKYHRLSSALSNKDLLIDKQDFCISWTDLEATLTNNQKKIISKCSGQIKQGEFIAIMGPSGAGKSTFMNILSGRQFSNSKINLKGQVKLNNHPIHNVDINRISSQVKQNEQLFEYITTKEAVDFSTYLTTNAKDKQSLSDATLEELGLVKSKDVYFGGRQIKGLSGGEKKRATIAVDLVSNPRILFLDEPTTGLDNFTAEKIVYKLKKINQKMGNTIIFTIHQPNSKMVKLFDRVILMVDGNISYDGNAKDVKQQFEHDLGFIFPKFSNPLDLIMVLCSRQVTDSGIIEDLNIKRSYDMDGNQVDDMIDKGDKFRNKPISNLELREMYLSQDLFQKKIENNLNIFQELTSVVSRTIKNDIRLPLSFNLKFVQYFVVILFNQNLYRSLQEENNVQNQKGFFFQCVSILTFSNIPIGSFIFSREKNIVLTELSNRRYRLFDYIIGKMISVLILNTIVFSFYSLVQFVIQVEKIDQSNIFYEFQKIEYLKFLLSVIIGGLNCIGSGFLLGVIVDNEDIAAACIIPWTLPAILLTGQLKSVCNMSYVLKHLTQTIPQQQFLSSLQSNIFNENDIFKKDNLCEIYCMINDYWQNIQIMMCWFIFQWIISQFVLWYRLSKGLE